MPRGAGTGMGNAVPENDVVVDVSKLNNILNISEQFADVEAGVALQDLNKAIRGEVFSCAA